MTTTHTLKALSKALLLATGCLTASTVFADQKTPEQLYPPLTSEVLPELAAKGSYSVGVQTLDLINPAQFDPATQGKRSPFKSRSVVPSRQCKRTLNQLQRHNPYR